MSLENPALPAHPLTRRTVLATAAGAVAVGGPLLTSPSATAATTASTAQITRAQERLNAQSYWCGPVSGVIDDLTTCALMAYQRVNGYAPDGILDYPMMQALAKPRPKPRFTTVGGVLEVDIKRQLLRVVSNGKVNLTLHATTGTGHGSEFGDRDVLDRTPRGKFRLRGSADGIVTNSLGTHYRPHYFLGRYSIFGRSDMADVRRPMTTGGVAIHVDALDLLARKRLLGRGRLVYIP